MDASTANSTVDWHLQASDMAARLVHVLGETTGKPVCEGGLAHYFVSEAHRRSDMIKRLKMPRRARVENSNVLKIQHTVEFQLSP